MPPDDTTALRHHLRRALLLRDGVRFPDAQLLECFVRDREEAAFEALVRRHGPMVLGVCRRVLRDAHDAEDAFQATFLVLARKAATIAARERLANWLHGVADRTARKARALADRRRARERPMTDVPDPRAADPDPLDDLRPLIDRELARLPAKYRAPVVLCDLEGRTHKEAARQLGCPEGTLSGRLFRARAMLAARLRRRGLTVPAAAVAAALASDAEAGVPASLVGPAVKLAFGRAVAPNAAAALAEGVLTAMRWTKIQSAALAGLAVGLVLALGGAVGHRLVTAAPPPAGDAGSLRDTILVLDQQYWEAASKHDLDTLRRLFADDYLGLSHDGTRWTRATLLDHHANVRTGELRRTTEREVVRLNDRAALLTYEAKFKVFTKSGALADTAHQKLTSCWVQRDGGWFVVFSQTTALPLPPAPGPWVPLGKTGTVEVSGPAARSPLDQLIDRALTAHGGADRLAKLTSFTMKMRQPDATGAALAQTHFVQLPDLCRVEISRAGGAATDVHLFDGTGFRRWRKHTDGRVEKIEMFGIDPSPASMKEQLRYFGPRGVLRLKDPAARKEWLGEVTVAGRPAYGVRLGYKSGGERRMFFDRETGLLVKEESGALETSFLNYKEFDGVPVARRTVQKTADGSWTLATDIHDFKPAEKFDPKLFRAP